MECKKTWFGYVTFAIGTLVFGLLSGALIFSYFCIDNGSGLIRNPIIVHAGEYASYLNASFPMSLSLIFALFWIAFGVCAYVFGRKLRALVQSKENQSKRNNIVKIVMEVVFGLIIFAGLFLRVKDAIAVSFQGVLIAPFNNTNVEDFLRYGPSGIGLSISSWYEYLLSMVYRFVGVKPACFIWVNLFLQLLGIMFVGFSVKKANGTVCACVVTAFLALSNPVRDFSYENGAENLLFFLCSLGLLIGITLVDSLSENIDMRVANLVLVPIVSLIFIGVVPMALKGGFKVNFLVSAEKITSGLFNAYFSKTMFLHGSLFVLFMMIGALSFIFGRRDRVSATVLIFIAMAVFYLFTDSNCPINLTIMAVSAVLAGIGVDEALFTIVETPSSYEKENRIKKSTKEDKDDDEDEPMVGGVEVGEEEINNSRKSEKQAKKDEIKKAKLEAKEAKKQVKQEAEDAKEQAKQEAEDAKKQAKEEAKEAKQRKEDEKLQKIEDKKKQKEQKKQEKIDQKEKKKLEKQEKENAKNGQFDFSEEDAEAEKMEQNAKLNPIENVLPLPKPHVKKNFDFAYEPEKLKMEFDVEIKGDDDFDI